jgi:SsrA-binding protein
MILLFNKKAKHDYEILKTYQAGVVLSGGEVKSLRKSHGSFADSFIKIIGGEAFLLNVQINPYAFADNKDYDPKRSRKLLLHQSEIQQIIEATNKKNSTLVPLSFETVGRQIKLNFGIGRGKKQFEKREDLKKRALARDVAREFKEKIKLS